MARPVRLVMLVLLSGLLLGLSCLSFAWSAKNSAGAQVSDPRLAHPVGVLRLAMAQIIRGANPVDPARDANVKRALALAPLEEEPFILAGLARLKSRDYEGAQAALRIARQRNPRSREALYLSADVALTVGDVATVVENLESLLRIAPRESMLPREVITLLATDPATGNAALAALRDDRLRSESLIALAKSGASTSRLLEAITLTRASKAFPSNRDAIAAITQPIVERSDFAEAYRIWSALIPGSPSRKPLIMDSEFTGTDPAPFGWGLRTSSDAFAEKQADGLVGEVYGRRGAQLARQLLLLTPGVYRLEVNVEVPNELVETVVLCAPSSEIGRIRLSNDGVMSANFSVPAGCAGQWLEIRARASDPPLPGAFHLRSIRIREAGV